MCPIIIYFADGHDRNGYILLSKLGCWSTDYDDSEAAVEDFGQFVVRWLLKVLLFQLLLRHLCSLGLYSRLTMRTLSSVKRNRSYRSDAYIAGTPRIWLPSVRIYWLQFLKNGYSVHA